VVAGQGEGLDGDSKGAIQVTETLHLKYSALSRTPQKPLELSGGLVNGENRKSKGLVGSPLAGPLGKPA